MKNTPGLLAGLLGLFLIQDFAVGYPIHYQTFIVFPDNMEPPQIAQPEPPPTPTHFVSAVQFTIQETSPKLLKRSEDLVVAELQQSLQQIPRLKDEHFTVQNNGNEVVVYVTTSEDVQQPMQELVQFAVQR